MQANNDTTLAEDKFNSPIKKIDNVLLTHTSMGPNSEKQESNTNKKCYTVH